MKWVVLLPAVSLVLTGCLKTRNEVQESEQRSVNQQQVVQMQRVNADVGNRFSELEEEMRHLNGRVDVVENQIEKGQSGVELGLKASQQQTTELNQKVILLQEALIKMEKDLDSMHVEVQALKSERGTSHTEKNVSSTKKDHYELAQDFFDKKDWKQAVLSYQKYRDESPKGAKWSEATYKIGVSFQELDMQDEAKTFYDEVVSKFPKSEEARRAKVRLKGLKK